MIGEVVGNYRIVSELGRGGMGVVYLAEHVQIGKPAALKVLQPQLSSDPVIVQRFFNEARAASAIDHPGIVEVFDFGRHTDGSAFIVMALLRGESLDHKLLYGALPPVDGASIVAQVAAALAAAHAQRIVHRDLKPDNVYLVPNDLMPGGVQVKLLDFGIAKLAGEQQAGFKTQTGALIGTPAYMSPEQCMGRADIDHRTDLYSLGCILFHVLTGRPPFLSDHGTGVMIAAHMRDPVPHPRSLNAAIPEPLAAITMRLLEKDPAARFQTATELRAALVAAGAAAPVTRPGANVDQYGATMVPIGAPASLSPNVAHAATTASGSAAQVVPPPRKRSSKAPLVIALGGVLAIAGVAIAIGANGGGDHVATSESPQAPTAPAPTPPTKPTKPQPAVQPPAKPLLAEATCPPGQVSGGDTQGHCCWRDQAWSSAKNRCIGAPTCPTGTAARGEQCLPVQTSAVVAAPVGPAIASIATVTTPAIQLDAKSYGPGDPIQVRFATAVHSPSSSRTWVTVVEAGKPPTAYGEWKFVDDGANVATVAAPRQPGVYEVRVHNDYPKKATNVQQVVAFTLVDPQAIVQPPPPPPTAGATPRSLQRLAAPAKVVAGAKVRVTFPTALTALPKERFWVTIISKGSSDSQWGVWEYVPPGAQSLELTAPSAAGDYEVRLHANYPTKATNVVHRMPLRID